jgi:hypothetical protein
MFLITIQSSGDSDDDSGRDHNRTARKQQHDAYVTQRLATVTKDIGSMNMHGSTLKCTIMAYAYTERIRVISTGQTGS